MKQISTLMNNEVHDFLSEKWKSGSKKYYQHVLSFLEMSSTKLWLLIWRQPTYTNISFVRLSALEKLIHLMKRKVCNEITVTSHVQRIQRKHIIEGHPRFSCKIARKHSKSGEGWLFSDMKWIEFVLRNTPYTRVISFKRFNKIRIF